MGKIQNRIVDVFQNESEYSIQVEQSNKIGNEFKSYRTRTFYLIRKYVGGFWFLHYPPSDETKMLSSEDLQSEHLVANYILKWAYLISINFMFGVYNAFCNSFLRSITKSN